MGSFSTTTANDRKIEKARLSVSSAFSYTSTSASDPDILMDLEPYVVDIEEYAYMHYTIPATGGALGAAYTQLLIGTMSRADIIVLRNLDAANDVWAKWDDAYGSITGTFTPVGPEEYIILTGISNLEISTGSNTVEIQVFMGGQT